MAAGGSAGVGKTKVNLEPLARAGRFFARLVVGGVALIVLGFAGFVFYFSNDPDLPQVEGLSEYKALRSTRVLDRNGVLIGEVGNARHTPLPFDKLPEPLRRAALADTPGFVDGSGVHLASVVGALLAAVVPARAPEGQGGIALELARAAFPQPGGGLRARLRDAALVLQATRKLSRATMVELRLNLADFGGGLTGVEEAARRFLGKSATQMDDGQAALLLGLLEVTPRIDPRKEPQIAKEKQCGVLRRMAAAGSLTAARAQQICREPLAFGSEARRRLSTVPEVVAAVEALLAEKSQNGGGDALGLQVKTAIDFTLQSHAWEVVERGLESLDRRLGVVGPSGRVEGVAAERRKVALARAHPRGLAPFEIVEGVVERVERDPRNPRQGRIVIDVGGGMGAVDLAEEPRFAGGADPADRPLSARVRAGDLLYVRHAPERLSIDEGAAPVELPLALELGPHAALVALEPKERHVVAVVGGYGSFAGSPDRTRRALPPGDILLPVVAGAGIESLRFTAWHLRGPLAFADRGALGKIANVIGAPVIREFAARAGVVNPLPQADGSAPATAVAAGVTPLELANLFATFVQNGRGGVPVLWPEEAVAPSDGPPVIRAGTGYIVTSLLVSAAKGGVTRAVGEKLQRPVAAYAATTREGDAWFVGYTPELVTAVWVGYDDERRLAPARGGGRAAANPAEELGLAFLELALDGKPPREFTRPSGVTAVRIDPRTGYPLDADAPPTVGVVEVYLPGTEPRAPAPSRDLLPPLDIPQGLDEEDE